MSGFRDHFSGHARNYAQARPGYPPELFAWLAAQAPLHALAWDAGCGNGQASVALAKHFDAVFASDPSEEQIRNATAHPRVRYAVEPAEQPQLGDAQVDLVTVAQAYHWFDQAAFCQAAQRVLKPGGVCAVWTYAKSSVDDGVDAVFDQLHDHILEQDWPSGREHVLNRYRDLPFPFDRLEAPLFHMHCQWTLAHYMGYLRSWSASQRYLRRTGEDAVQKIAAAMAAAWGDPSLIREVSWPLMLLAGRR